MEYDIKVGDIDIKLIHDDVDQTINVDDLTTIDVSNINGEKLTIDTAMNRIALLKSDALRNQSSCKLELDIYESNFKKRLRKDASKNGGKYKIRVDEEDVEIKLTEKGLETSFESEQDWIDLKNNLIEADFAVNALDNLYWSCQNKNTNLKSFVVDVTPEEFMAGVIGEKVNGIFIKRN